MAINPPSDLVLDVAMAADPQAMRTSMVRLRNMAADRVAAQTPLSRENFASLQQGGQTLDGGAAKTPAPNPAFRKFEAFMLQSFVESMFAGDNQAVYGKGIAGDYWKSMMSEAIANQMADAGGIGVARMLDAQSAKREKSETAEPVNAVPDTSGDQSRGIEQDLNVILHPNGTSSIAG